MSKDSRSNGVLRIIPNVSDERGDTIAHRAKAFLSTHRASAQHIVFAHVETSRKYAAEQTQNKLMNTETRKLPRF